MTFTNRTPAVKTPEQKKLSSLAWRLSKQARERQKSGQCVTVFKKGA